MRNGLFTFVCVLCCSLALAQQPCDIIYVSPSGNSITGTATSPTSLQYAMNLVSGTRRTIRVLEGTYNINGSLTLPADSVKIDGGYRIDGSGNWVKRSDALTVINLGGFQTDVVGGVTVGHTIGIKASNINGWTLQDLTINVSSTPGTTSGRGHSVYGLHILNCANYSLIRCIITTASGTNGSSGSAISGTGGAGGGGAGGLGSGYTSGCGGASSPGSPGSPGNGGAAGGPGGSGVGNGSCNIFGCDASGNWGRSGGNGAPGANGTGYAPGDRPSANLVANVYYVPNDKTNGGNGFGGGGGGGGSGAAIGTCCLCSCGSGNASGGNGGRGGDGGLGGEGGYGGGASIAIYAYGGGSGLVKDCSLQPGSGGIGGQGAAGQPGSAGALGSFGGYHSRCDGFYGGNGGAGGSGGSGGRGRDGANGPSMAIAQFGGALVSQSGTYPVNPPLLAVDYKNIAACPYSEINITKTSGAWDLTGSGASFVNDLSATGSSYNNQSNNALIYFTSRGGKTIKLNGIPYESFITLTRDRQMPVINSLPAAICVGDAIQLGTPEQGIIYEWEIYNQNGVRLQTFGAQNPGSYVPPSTGVYTVRFRVRTECCGWSIPVYASVDVQPYPAVTLSGLSSSYCLDDAPVTLVGNPSGGTFTGPVVSGNVFDPQNAGVGVHQIIYSYATPIGCGRSDTATVTVLQPPAVSFTGLNPDYCITQPGSALTGLPAGGTFSGPGVGGNTFVPFLAGVGTHVVSYHYVAPNGCDATASQTTIVNDQPVITFVISPNTFCVNDPVYTLLASPFGGTFSGPGVTGNQFDPAAAGVGGPYVITYTFTDTIGCRNTASKSQSVVVTNVPVVSISGVNPKYCLNDPPATLNGFPSGGTFLGNGVVGNQFDPLTAGPGTHQIQYTYTSAGGCTNFQTVSTTVHPLPQVTLSGLSPVYCIDALPAQMTGSPPGGTFSGPGLIANSFNPSLAGAGGPHRIVYSYTDQNGCKGSDTSLVIVNDIPQLQIIGLDAEYCSWVGPVSLALIPAGGQLVGPGVAGNTFNPSQAGVGNHTLVYIYSDNAGCTNSMQVSVRVAQCTGVNLPDVPEVNIYPNPSNGRLHVKLTGATLPGSVLAIYNMQGQCIYRTKIRQWQQHEETLDFTSHAKGMYYLRLQTDKEVVVEKIILQ
ncbi:MAG: hypothetical protein KatS3mg031_1688 [Chitinophagales bacterium]|nr:MAG: hypothetical protein KatS3mg031_1688 [Chitinophagales bacterium]